MDLHLPMLPGASQRLSRGTCTSKSPMALCTLGPTVHTYRNYSLSSHHYRPSLKSSSKWTAFLLLSRLSWSYHVPQPAECLLEAGLGVGKPSASGNLPGDSSLQLPRGEAAGWGAGLRWLGCNKSLRGQCSPVLPARDVGYSPCPTCGAHCPILNSFAPKKTYRWLTNT